MSSLAVVVYLNGKVRRNAVVQLNGPRGVRTLKTNSAGAVTFSDLASGAYIVNAAYQSQYLGAGHMTIRPGGSGVIHIRHPKPSFEWTTGGIVVSVKVGGQKISGAHIQVSGPDMSRSLLMEGVTARFSRVKPGEYKVTASVTFDGGLVKMGSARTVVHAGGTAKVAVNVDSPPPLPPPRPIYADRDLYDLLDEKDTIESEIKKLEERLDRLEGCRDINNRRYRGGFSKGPSSMPSMRGGESKDGGDYADFGEGYRSVVERPQQIDKTHNELGRLKNRKDAIDKAISYKFNYE